jgi:hypothetical protein
LHRFGRRRIPLAFCLHKPIVAWALATGSTLEDRPVYVKTSCFEPFPFPTATPEQATRIRDLAEQLDAHRKRQQAAHAGLTLTGMYNVLEKLRSRRSADAKEKTIHEQGLVSVLKSCTTNSTPPCSPPTAGATWPCR